MFRKAVTDIAKKTWADTVSSRKNQQNFNGACQLSQLSNEVDKAEPAKNGEISHKNLFADSVISSTGKTR